eukprot:Anaeramoba_ignava/c16052_g1_i1.p1 GENE.c16052_g1_i1~~c16052_g1_i1.p1  ORF type:complete len:288 (+),score=129.13 c16052_g1_i1:967-1830(+)
MSKKKSMFKITSDNDSWIQSYFILQSKFLFIFKDESLEELKYWMIVDNSRFTPLPDSKIKIISEKTQFTVEIPEKDEYEKWEKVFAKRSKAKIFKEDKICRIEKKEQSLKQAISSLVSINIDESQSKFHPWKLFKFIVNLPKIEEKKPELENENKPIDNQEKKSYGPKKNSILRKPSKEYDPTKKLKKRSVSFGKKPNVIIVRQQENIDKEKNKENDLEDEKEIAKPIKDADELDDNIDLKKDDNIDLKKDDDIDLKKDDDIENIPDEKTSLVPKTQKKSCGCCNII